MQTRRDQLQAYRFQNRRALAALVTGEPNVLEAPMRRLTTTTVSGIMVAILVAAIFALIGLFKPATGDAWRQPGAIIVDKDSPSIYVLLSDKKLHAVVNYASAVLAVGQKTDPHVEYVDNDDLAGTPRGATIGIPGLPYSLPSAGDLVSAKADWSVCSRQSATSTGGVRAGVSLVVDGDDSASPVESGSAVLARSVNGRDTYVLYQGTRFPIEASGGVLASLQLQSATPVVVGTGFLNGVPAGPAFKTPTVSGAGTPITGYTVNGVAPHVGQTINIDDGQAYLLALADGVAILNPVQNDLLATVPVNAAGATLPPINADKSEEVRLANHQSGAAWNAVKSQFAGLPAAVPRFDNTPADRGGICAVYPGGSGTPTFAVPPSLKPAYANAVPSESAASAHGMADTVDIPAGGAALVRSKAGAKTVYVIATPGRKFPAASVGVLKGFGYDKQQPVTVAAQLLPLIGLGKAFDPSAALRAASG